jgi:hypothetical protein
VKSSAFPSPSLCPVCLQLGRLVCIFKGFVEVFERGVGA